jgi:hypothetical protein
MPAGVALIAKLAIKPPVEETVKPVAAMLTVRVSDEEERVKAVAARAASTVRVNV